MLERRILDGSYAVGEKLPTEEMLAKEFGVNRHTLRRAMDYLLKRNYIKRAPRVGSVVISNHAQLAAEEKTRLRYIYISLGVKSLDQKRDRAYRALAEDFMEREPSIELELCPIQRKGKLMCPYIPEFNELNTAVVVQLAYVADYARRGAFMALEAFDDLADVTAQLDGRLIRKNLGFDDQEHIYALPVDMVTWMGAANLTLLKKLGYERADIPGTRGEFLALCEAIHAQAGETGVYPIEPELLHGNIQSTTRYLSFIYGDGNRDQLFDSSGHLQIDRPEAIDFLAWLVKLYQLVPPPKAREQAWFLEKKSVFRLSASNSFFLYYPSTPDCEICPFPFPVKSKDSVPATIVNGAYTGILAHSIMNDKQKMAAWRFLKFLCSQAVQESNFKQLQTLPSRMDLYPVIASLNNEASTFYDYAFRYGKPAFDVPENNEIHRILFQSISKALTGLLSPAEALREAQSMLNDYVFCQRVDAVEVATAVGL